MEGISRPKKPGLKLGCFGALGLVLITQLYTFSQFSMYINKLPAPLAFIIENTRGGMTLAVWLGMPFLVSFLATGKNGDIRQGLLAGSIATLFGMGTCAVIEVIRNPRFLYPLLFFLPLIILCYIMLIGLGTATGLARSLVVMRMGLWGGIVLIALTISSLLFLRLADLFHFQDSLSTLLLYGLAVVVLAAWLCIPFVVSFLVAKQTSSVRQAIGVGSFASLLGAAGTFITDFIFSIIFPQFQRTSVFYGDFLVLTLVGLLGVILSLIGSFIGQAMQVR